MERLQIGVITENSHTIPIIRPAFPTDDLRTNLQQIFEQGNIDERFLSDCSLPEDERGYIQKKLATGSEEKGTEGIRHWEIIDRIIEYHRRRPYLGYIYELLKAWELNLQSVQVGNYRVYQRDMLKGDYDLLEREVETSGMKRPCWIFHCVDQEGSHRVVKAIIDPDEETMSESLREIAFYTGIGEVLLRGLPNELQGCIGVPEIGRIQYINTEAGVGAIFETEHRGLPIGLYHYEAREDITQEELDMVLVYISYLHDRNINWWRDNASSYYQTLPWPVATENGEVVLDNLHKYKERFTARKRSILRLIETYTEDRPGSTRQETAEEYIRRMEEILFSGEAENIFIIPEEKLMVIMPDVDLGNILRYEGNKYYHIDATTAEISHRGTEYVFLVISLWQSEELYDHALKYALSSLDAKGREIMRYEMIYYRLSGVAIRFYVQRLEEAQRQMNICHDPQEKSALLQEINHCTRACTVLCSRLQEAIDKKGVWANF